VGAIGAGSAYASLYNSSSDEDADDGSESNGFVGRGWMWGLVRRGRGGGGGNFPFGWPY
jgi:hypothetical protein